MLRGLLEMEADSSFIHDPRVPTLVIRPAFFGRFTVESGRALHLSA